MTLIEKIKWERRVLFTALRAGETLEVSQLEKNGEIQYGFRYGEKKEQTISREELLKELDRLGWSDWQVEARGLMNDFNLGMEVLERIREEGREPWRQWLKSSGWIQATVVGSGAWGERMVSYLEEGTYNRYGSLGRENEEGLLSTGDQLRILLTDSQESIGPEARKWIQGDGNSISWIFTLKKPEVPELPGLWVEMTPGHFRGGLEDVLRELFEGCCPFGLVTNAFHDLVPLFSTPKEGIAKLIRLDGENWLDDGISEVASTIKSDSRWEKIDLLFLMIQSTPGMVDPAQLYPLSLAIRQGVSTDCRVMASIKENPEWKAEQVQVLLLGMCGEAK